MVRIRVEQSARALRFKSGRKVYAIAEPPTQTANSVSEKPSAREDEIKQRGGRFDWNRQWYPVAVTNDLHTDAPYGVTVIGRPLAVWWDASSSKWQVYADECPHRLAPLSEGSISEDGHLRCSYHGWTFKGDGGECTRIPQALPTSARPVRKNPHLLSSTSFPNLMHSVHPFEINLLEFVETKRNFCISQSFFIMMNLASTYKWLLIMIYVGEKWTKKTCNFQRDCMYYVLTEN